MKSTPCSCLISINCHSTCLELEHLVDESHSLLADGVGARHPHVLEVYDARVGRVHPDLVNLLGPNIIYYCLIISDISNIT